MRQSRLLIFNTAISYIRMAITMPMGLLITRYVYGAMGEIDFGLFSTLVASGVFLEVFNAALISSAQRHLAFAIGKNDQQEIRNVFRAVLCLFAITGPLVLLVGFFLAPAILSALEIPSDRTTASWWVLHIAISSIAFQTLMTPFRSLITAHQELSVLAVIEVLSRIANLVLVSLLFILPGDRLLIYAWIVTALSVFSSLSAALYCLTHHEESRVLPLGASRENLRHVADFAGWIVIGKVADLFRNRGALLLVAARFGAASSAAFAIALQLHYFVYRLTQGIGTAILPVITSQAGRGNNQLIDKLTTAGNKYPAIVASLLWIPIMFECEAILELWLNRSPPPGTAMYSRFFCSMAYVGISSWGFSMALQALDRIRLASVLSLTAAGISLCISWIGCQWLKWPAWSIPAAMLISTTFLSVFALPVIVARVQGRSAIRFLLEGPVRALLAIAVGALVAGVVHSQMLPGTLRLILVTVVNSTVCLGTAWYAVLLRDEQLLLRQVALRLVTGQPGDQAVGKK